MAVSDVPYIFEEHTAVLLLYPSVIHGYLFHYTGELLYLILALCGLIYPSIEFALKYQHELEEDMFDYDRPQLEQLNHYFSIAFVVLILIHLLGILGLIYNMNSEDYIMVFLFLGAVFISLVGIITSRTSELATKVLEISGRGTTDSDQYRDNE